MANVELPPKAKNCTGHESFWNTLELRGDFSKGFRVHCLGCGRYGDLKPTQEEAILAWNKMLEDSTNVLF